MEYADDGLGQRVAKDGVGVIAIDTIPHHATHHPLHPNRPTRLAHPQADTIPLNMPKTLLAQLTPPTTYLPPHQAPITHHPPPPPSPTPPPPHPPPPPPNLSTPNPNLTPPRSQHPGGKIIPLGAYWGEDMIITSPALRDTRPATALTYVEIGTLSKVDFEECLLNFPQSERHIRTCALKIAMQRAGLIISSHLNDKGIKAGDLAAALRDVVPGATVSSLLLTTYNLLLTTHY